jgi:hypothetical protein
LSLSIWLSHQYPIHIPLLPHLCYMSCSSHAPWLDHSNYTWRRVQVMMLLVPWLGYTGKNSSPYTLWPWRRGYHVPPKSLVPT